MRLGVDVRRGAGDGFDDHVPTMSDDPENYRSRAYAMGYIKALMDAVGGPA